jgi:hypothetical protein
MMNENKFAGIRILRQHTTPTHTHTYTHTCFMMVSALRCTLAMLIM